MAHDIAHDTNTPADEVRRLLDTAEGLLPLMRERTSAVSQLLGIFDQLDARIPTLEQQGVDLRGERGRWEALQRGLRSRARWAVSAITSWPAARQQAQPQPEQWWWRLDETLAAERRRAWLRGAVIVLLVVTVGVVGTRLFRFYFPVDPNVAAANDRRLQAERHVREGDWAGAFSMYEQATQFAPDDPMLYLWLGVLSEQMGRPEQAEPWYDKARPLLHDAVRFHVERGFVYLQANRAADGEREARTALDLDNQSAVGYYVLASALEMQKQTDAAIEAYKMAASLAEGNDPDLTALARVHMGLLLQSAPFEDLRMLTPTP